MKSFHHTRVNIGFVVRQDYKKFFGGDVIHPMLLKRYLEKAGASVTLLDPPYELKGIDVCHAFNLVRPFEAFNAAKRARAAGVPFVLTPIFGDTYEFGLARRTPTFRLIQTLGKSAIEYSKFAYLKLVRKSAGLSVDMIDSIQSIQQKLVNLSDAIITQSNWEANYLAERFGGNRYKTIRTGGNHLAGGMKKKERAVVCVGMFCDNKNQLSLVRAAQYFDCRFVFVGDAAPGYGWYFRRCRQLAPSNCEFLGKVQHERVADVLAAAKVFALPSFVETACMAALEAANFGCNLVISDRPVMREYFPGTAYFCDPYSVESIIRRLAEALNDADDARGAKNLITANYRWEDIAAEFLNFYSAVRRY